MESASASDPKTSDAQDQRSPTRPVNTLSKDLRLISTHSSLFLYCPPDKSSWGSSFRSLQCGMFQCYECSSIYKHAMFLIFIHTKALAFILEHNCQQKFYREVINISQRSWSPPHSLSLFVTCGPRSNASLYTVLYWHCCFDVMAFYSSLTLYVDTGCECKWDCWCCCGAGNYYN